MGPLGINNVVLGDTKGSSRNAFRGAFFFCFFSFGPAKEQKLNAANKN
jgi:hypothetical protein